MYGVPIRVSRDAVWFFGIALCLISSAPFILIPHWFFDVAHRGDIADFWAAGATAGTAALTDVARHVSWMQAHHLDGVPFVYPPAVAWLYAPLALMPVMPAMVAEEIAMAGVFVACALVEARTYGFPAWFAIVAVFAWAPAINSIEVGQNSGLALLLVLGIVAALASRRPLLAGILAGALLYKPTEALPMLILLAARREWRSLGLACIVGAGLYLASVAAAHGDWFWPAQYAATLHGMYAADLAGAAPRTYTLPTLLLSLGAPSAVAAVATLAVWLAAIPLLARRPLLEAASLAPFVGLSLSPHAWFYEAAVMLPAMFFAMRALAEPLRTRVVAATYLLVAFGSVTPHLGHILAVVCAGGTVAWLWAGWARFRQPTQLQNV